MKRKILMYLFIVFVGVLAQEAQADYMYSFSFDSLTYNGIFYPADSFSFVTPNLLLDVGTLAVVPGGELNGFSFSAISVVSLPLPFNADLISFSTIPDYTRPIGEIADFWFNVSPAATSVGKYSGTDNAGRGISLIPGMIIFQYTSGTLIIQSVPEPSTMLLLASGLLGLWGAKRKLKR
jgi:hypothetical protein